MATSRDDFVIAIRSAFIKKGNKQRFSLIALIIFSIILIIFSRLNIKPVNYLKSGINEIIYRVSFVVSLPEQQLNRFIIIIDKHFQVYNKFEDMTEEIENLKEKKYNSEYLIEENKKLRRLIDEYIFSSKEIVAKVLLDKNSPFLKSVIVNKGTKDNIKIGMAVLDGPYLIGKIVEVNYMSSRVLLISDLNSKIPVILEPGNIQSILSGTGKRLGEIQYYQKEKYINEEKIVYTSGSGGIFKAGIPVGSLRDLGKVEFYSDLSQLTFVKIVSFEKDN
tara:strand:+ start:1026 stop:1856 length:831 start_codon:yes stop_codon:yes gene_type:complete